MTNLVRKGWFGRRFLLAVAGAVCFGITNVGAMELPREYWALEYVEATGSQVVDTGVVPTSKTRVELDFAYTKLDTAAAISLYALLHWGANAHGEAFGFSCRGGQFQSIVDSTDQSPVVCGTATTDRSQVSLASGEQKIKIGEATDWTTYATTSFPDVCQIGETLYLFARHIEWSPEPDRFSYVRLYSGKVYENGELVRDLVPAQHKRSCAVGLFDRVTGEFLVSLSATPLTASTIEQDYVSLSYIESTDAQYIATGVSPTLTTEVDIDFQYTEIPTATRGIFGEAITGDTMDYYLMATVADGKATFNSLLRNSKEVRSACLVTTDRYQFHLENGVQKYRLDGAAEWTTYGDNAFTSVSGATTFYLLGRHTTWGDKYNYPGRCRLYSCQIREENELVHDYVPAVRVGDGKVGVYDRQAKSFLAPTGSDFPIPEGDLKPATYLESTGNQYIDTGVVAENDVKVDVDFQLTANEPCMIASWCGGGAISMQHASDDTYRYAFVNAGYASHTISSKKVGFNRHTASIANGEQTFDGEVLDTLTADAFKNNQPGTIALFARHKRWDSDKTDSYDNKAKMKLYSCKIYKAGNLVRDFRPVILDCVKGLYDDVGKKLYVSPENNLSMRAPSVPCDFAVTELRREASKALTGADFAFAAAESPRRLYAAYGRRDKGADEQTWIQESASSVTEVAIVPAHAESLSVEMPSAVVEALRKPGYGVRFFLSPIPLDYTPVEYVESVGGQGVDTGIIPNAATTVSAEFALTTATPSGSQAVFALAGTGAGSAAFVFGAAAAEKCFCYALAESGYANTTKMANALDTARHSVSLGSERLVFDGTVVSDSTSKKFTNPNWNTFDAGKGLEVLARRQRWTGKSKDTVDWNSTMKFYSFKCYNQLTLACDYVPCVRNSDNVAGFWDRASGTFKASDTAAAGMLAGERQPCAEATDWINCASPRGLIIVVE